MRSVYKIKSPSMPGFKNIDNVNRIAIYYLWMKSCTIVAKKSTFFTLEAQRFRKDNGFRGP